MAPDALLLEPRDVLGGGEVEDIDELVADLMGALSNPTRTRALFALLEAGELSTGELAKAVWMSPSATSHQLRILRDLGLLKRCREGRRASTRWPAIILGCCSRRPSIPWTTRGYGGKERRGKGENAPDRR